MHYHNIFLVKAESKENAITQVKDFLSKHEKEWDWYQFGGGWMWSNLENSYMGVMLKNKEVYINPFYDEPYVGKKVLITLPNGKVFESDYGSSIGYLLRRYIHEHPEDSEVKSLMEDGAIELMAKQIDYRENKQTKLAKWSIEAYFWNITANSPNYDGEESPSEWFLVNVDLHL